MTKKSLLALLHSVDSTFEKKAEQEKGRKGPNDWSNRFKKSHNRSKHGSSRLDEGQIYGQVKSNHT